MLQRPRADANSVRSWDPAPLESFLTEHSVAVAKALGWDTLGNGELLAAAEAAGFDVLVTTDKNMRYQQNLASRKIAIVVLANAQWPVLRLSTHLVTAALNAVTPGSYTEVHVSERRDE